MDKAFFLSLYRYNFHANRLVWDCMIKLPESKLLQPIPYSIGSLFHQSIHVMGVEHWWFHFLCDDKLEFIEDDVDYPTPEAIRSQWDETEAYIMAYLNTLTPDELQREVKPPFWDDIDPAVKVWQGMMQVINHSTDHRAQMLRMLHDFGAPTVEQDYLNYLLETP
jgi:uncharacterized damage-inducible protein DinB